MVRWLTLAALAAPGFAFAAPVDRDALLDLLNAYEEAPSAAELEALGSGVEAELLAVAVDEAVPLTRRARAVSALRFYPSGSVRSFLESQLAAGTDELVRRKAIYSLAAFGSAALPPLTGALADPDVQTRIAAANAIGTIGGSSARSALKAQLGAEKDPAVKDAIQAAIRSMP